MHVVESWSTCEQNDRSLFSVTPSDSTHFVLQMFLLHPVISNLLALCEDK